jgi:hypothetical protein
MQAAAEDVSQWEERVKALEEAIEEKSQREKQLLSELKKKVL